MSLFLSIAAAAAVQVVPDCAWNEPGRDPFTGDPVAAVQAYADIPPATRQELAAKLARHAYDDEVLITRDAIEGAWLYEPQIRGMHFGARRMCERVSRSRWTGTHTERAHVVCADGACLMVPEVCGNVSRVTRRAGGGVASGGRGDGELAFQPPSAGFARPLPPPPPPLVVEPLTPPAPPSFSVGMSLPPPPTPGAGELRPPPLAWGVPMPPPLFGVPPVPVAPAVPEPLSWAMFAFGLLALVGAGKARR